MSLAFTWGSSPGNLGNAAVRLGKIDGLVQVADRGQFGSCSLPIDDPSGSVLLAGLDPVLVGETSATNTRVWTGYAAERDVARGDDSLILGAARRWQGALVDLNAAFTFKVIRGTSAKRPAETVDARIAWILGYASGFPDNGLVVASSLVLSATDYTGMFPNDVFNDCGELTGYNYFRYYDETANESSLAFFPNSYTGYDSTLRLTNVAADVNGSTTFGAIGTLNRDPSDRYNGVLVIYNGGQVFVTSGSGDDRQTSITKDTISSAAHATAVGQRFLDEHSVDVDHITAICQLPKAHVNDAMPGQRMQVKFSHLPGYTSYTYMRIAQRTVAQDKETDELYTVTFDLRDPRSTGGSGGGPGGGGGSVGNPGVPSPPLPPWVPCDTPDPHYYGGTFEFDYPGSPAGLGASFPTPGLFLNDSVVAQYNYSYTITLTTNQYASGGFGLRRDGPGPYPPLSPTVWDSALFRDTSEPTVAGTNTYTGSFSNHSGADYQYAAITCEAVGAGGHCTVTFYVDPVGWVAPAAEDCTPLPGQVVVSTNGAPELVTMATGDTVGQLNWPYPLGGLHIFVSGYGEVIVDQTDPLTGTFELPFPKPAGAQVYGWYLAGSGPATGATNGPAIAELDYIPPELLGSGSDRSGDNVLHDDWTWGPSSIDTSDFERKTEGGQDTIKVHGNTGSTETFDPTDGNVHTATLNVNCTVTLNAPTGSGAATLEIFLTQDATGSRTVTWPGSVVWPGGTAPTLSTAPGAVDRIVLETVNVGTTWYGTIVGGGATGTVTSVALTVPAELSVAGSPITTSGTLAVTKATQSANQVWAGPTSGSAAQPAFRALIAADIPSGIGVTDHQHIDNVTFSGDGSTTAFELPAAPFDAYSVQAFVAGVRVGQSLSGTMLTTLTFDTAPASGTDNISVDITAAAA